MLMKRKYLDQVRAGTKTATLRPWKRCVLGAGDRLVFNGGLRVIITRVVVTAANTLSDDDVRALGFVSRAAFARAWRRLYPLRPFAAPCVVLHFRLPS